MTYELRIENLTVRTADDTVLVSDVSLVCGPSNPICLIGETGSGKSLVMHAIMGSLPDSLSCDGKILLDGTDILPLSPQQRRELWGRKFALLPQEPWLSLDPTMRVGAQVAELYTDLRGIGRKQANQMAADELASVGLAGSFDAYPFELSGGMAQRVSIAMAHAAQSPIMLADEPTKGLDRALCDVVADLLRGEVTAGRTLMVITHDLELAEKVGGTVGVMRKGRLLELGTADQVLRNPSHEYSRELVAALPANWPVRTPARGEKSDEIVVAADSIGKSFGRNTLFSDVDVGIAKGQVTIILGPSGSGKSTLGNILLKLIKPDAGHVSWGDDLPAMKYQKIYQDPPSAFIAGQTLGRAFADLRKLHNIDGARINAMLDQLGLDRGLLARRPDAISGGELQRFAIARSLLLDPVMLFADEATSRLDPVSQKRVIDLLCAQVRDRGLALLLVTHDPDLAEHIADHIIRISDGDHSSLAAKAA